MKNRFLVPLALLIATSFGCQKEIANDQTTNANYHLQLTFKNNVGNQQMQLGNSYQNQFNEEFTLTAFRYYISNIELQQGNGTVEKFPDVYHLVDQDDAATYTIDLPVKNSNYSRVSFLIGVDSARNVSGTQAGDLDPAKGMFWTWNSGYVMAKMEATSPLSTATNQKVEYHIGGFTTGQNVTRRVSFNLAGALAVNIKGNGSSAILLNADALKWFTGSHDLKIATNPVCIMPGPLAVQYADNYANMFTIAGVVNN